MRKAGREPTPPRPAVALRPTSGPRRHRATRSAMCRLSAERMPRRCRSPGTAASVPPPCRQTAPYPSTGRMTSGPSFRGLLVSVLTRRRSYGPACGACTRSAGVSAASQAAILLRHHDRRLAGVHGFQRLPGRARQDREALPPGLALPPDFPQPREAERAPARQADPGRLLPRRRAAPLEPAVRRHQAPPAPERRTERGLPRRRLRPRVDQPTPDRSIPHPGRHQAPALKGQDAPPSGIETADEEGLSRRPVPALRKLDVRNRYRGPVHRHEHAGLHDLREPPAHPPGSPSCPTAPSPRTGAKYLRMGPEGSIGRRLRWTPSVGQEWRFSRRTLRCARPVSNPPGRPEIRVFTPPPPHRIQGTFRGRCCTPFRSSRFSIHWQRGPDK